MLRCVHVGPQRSLRVSYKLLSRTAATDNEERRPWGRPMCLCAQKMTEMTAKNKTIAAQFTCVFVKILSFLCGSSGGASVGGRYGALRFSIAAALVGHRLTPTGCSGLENKLVSQKVKGPLLSLFSSFIIF